MADHVTAIMHEANMPTSFWNHAVAAYVYVWNLTFLLHPL